MDFLNTELSRDLYVRLESRRYESPNCPARNVRAKPTDLIVRARPRRCCFRSSMSRLDGAILRECTYLWGNVERASAFSWVI